MTQPYSQFSRPSASPAPSSQRRDAFPNPQGRFTPQAPTQPNYHQTTVPLQQYTAATPSQNQQTAPRNTVPAQSSYPVAAARSHEAFVLPDTANTSIPPQIRKQFQQDQQGRILFFTTPPLDVLPSVKQGQALGHSLSYLATQAKQEDASADRKRKFLEKARMAEERDRSKKAKVEDEANLAPQLEALKSKALHVLVSEIQKGTDDFYKAHYGEKAKEVQALDNERSRERQNMWAKRDRERTEGPWTTVSHEQDFTGLRGSGVFKDDYDARY